MHLGVAHTHGDAVAWLPEQKILFTGDVCVNGPFNYVGDGNIGKWIATLEAAKKLGAKTVCPGHGPRSTSAVLDDQQAFFKALQDQVSSKMANVSPDQTKNKIEAIRSALKANNQIARYVSEPGKNDGFPSQVQKVYEEMTGKTFAAFLHEPHSARHAHARSHGVAST